MGQEAITQIERHLKAAQSKRPGWAAGIWGEAGVGKTFTVQALLNKSPIKSLSLHSTISLQALSTSLPRPAKLPLWAEHILERQAQHQQVETQSFVDALGATLAQLAPFVLHLEDLHEANPERTEFIQKLARILPRLRGVGLLVTSRSEAPEPFKGYRLEPLSKTDSDGLLEAQAGGKLPVEGLEYVFTKAQGNALFTLEFYRYLSRQGFFWSDGQSWHWRKPPEDFVPVSLEVLIAQLAQGVSPEAQAVMEARAIFPNTLEVDQDLWASVAGVSQTTLKDSLPNLWQKGLLQQEGFAHPLIREVVAQEIPAARKQSYARRALDRLCTSQPEWAVEFVELAGLEPHQALPLIEQAAQRANARGDKPGRARWLAKAVEYSQDRAERALHAAQALKDFNLVQAIGLAEIAAESLNPEAVFLLAELQANQGQVHQAEQTLLRLAQTEQVKLRWWETLILFRESRSLFAEAVELWDQQPEHQAKARPRTYQAVIYALVLLQRLDQAQALADVLSRRSLTPLKQLGLLNLRAMIVSDQGKPQLAVGLQQQNLELCRKLGLIPASVMSLLNLSNTLDKLGNRAQSQAMLEEARTLALQSGITQYHAIIQMRLAIFMLEQGAFEQAETLMLESHALLHSYSNLTHQTESHLKQARLYLTWLPPHGPPLARKHASAALEYARQTQDAKFIINALASLARAEVLLNHPLQALNLAQEAVQLCQQKEHQSRRSTALHAYAVALEASGRVGEALQAIQQASFQETEATMIQRYGLEADRISGDLEGARRHYQWFMQQGLPGLAQVALRYFPKLSAASEALPIPAPTASTIYLRVLGKPCLELSGQPVAVRARKRLEILCYLLEARVAGKNEVSVHELVDALYPQMPEKEARTALKQLIYLIRLGLGEESVHSTAGGYALGAVGADLEDFLKSGDSNLWRGPYLKGSEGWNANVRDGLLAALRSKVEALLMAEPVEAARLGEIWLEMEPYDLEALLLTLRALQATGNAKTTLQVYQQGQQRFKEVGESLPDLLEGFLQTPTLV